MDVYYTTLKSLVYNNLDIDINLMPNKVELFNLCKNNLMVYKIYETF